MTDPNPNEHEPIFKTPMDLLAAQMREQYLSMRRSGFGRWEACFIVASIAVLPGNQGGDSDA